MGISDTGTISLKRLFHEISLRASHPTASRKDMHFSQTFPTKTLIFAENKPKHKLYEKRTGQMADGHSQIHGDSTALVLDLRGYE